MTEELRNVILDSIENGVITAKQISKMGIHRSALRELVESGDIIRCSRGIYMPAYEWEDEYRLLQEKYSRGIYSHETALYLHGYCERIPISFHMTFPYGYNCPSIKRENIIIK
ncbi:MAG: type IV toxin-antitoxin system AbiEi family antitoxin domain-containing protein, partial [Lachnospiraceae bacterium]|nr:type IV toxin-antitoxin system AbiEi family antitoxin domain-containing protein [Lachnospiraceae bacterium]